MRKKVNCRLGIMGGSTGFRFIERTELERLGAVSTPYGDSAAVFRGRGDEGEFLFVSRHGEGGYRVSAPFVNYRANVWAMKELGVERIVAWSGPAAISPDVAIGEILVPGDLIDETRRRATTFYENTGLGFIRQNPVFCPEVSLALAECVRDGYGHCRTDDVYVCTEGPRLETPAEIGKFRSNGGSLVGMTLVPEVFLARELEMCYSMVCYITNYAEGVRPREFRPGVLFEGLLDEQEVQLADEAAVSVGEMSLTVVAKLAGTPRKCRCGQAMERYRRRGDIGDDWHTWRLGRGETGD